VPPISGLTEMTPPAPFPEEARSRPASCSWVPVPVTRFLGQSPAGLSATGDSETRNYYDMISARPEIDLRPQLERLDRLIARSEGIDPAALTTRIPAAVVAQRRHEGRAGAVQGEGHAGLRRA